MIRRFIGNKAFYRQVVAVALPIIIQNGIVNFVSLLDNIMVGQVGTAQMSGVSIVNQLIFVFNLCIFGATSGAGIFTAQFHGRGDEAGIRHTFRFKLLSGTVITLLGLSVFLFLGNLLISLYLKGEGDPADAAKILEYGREYMLVMLWGLPAFAVSSAYSSTLRETGQTVVPMVSGTVAVFVNLFLNWVLIFGYLGFPAMGVRSVALATVVARYIDLAIVAIWTHCNHKKKPFIQGAYRSMYIPAALFRSIVRKGTPLLINEALWSSGMAVMNLCYSTRGLNVVPAMNISSTIYNLSGVVFLAMGNAVAIIIGQMLGAGEPAEKVKDTDRKLIFTSVISSLLFAALMAAISGLFPQIYNTTDDVRSLATKLICISALFMPFNAFTHATYFTLRSGGKTLVTFLFDSCFVWVLCIPLALILTHFTSISILWLYFVCQGMELVKCGIGTFMLKQGKWIQNLTQQ